MATAYETRQNKDEKAIAEAQRKQEQTVSAPDRNVRQVGGVKIIVKEDPDTGLVQQTKISNGSWAR